LGDRRFTRKEAYELAQSRGYGGAITSLNRDLADGRLKPFGVAIVPAPERKKGFGAKNYLDDWG
jgi:hypothetical protein